MVKKEGIRLTQEALIHIPVARIPATPEGHAADALATELNRSKKRRYNAR